MVDQSYPAALKAARPNSAALNPAALKDGWSMAMPRAASTALKAATLFMSNSPRVRAAKDAMSCGEEDTPPALAASMMRTQRRRVTSSAAARHTSLAACNVY
jgi:hypothetical protein